MPEIPTEVEIFPWKKMSDAIEKVRERLERATAALDAADVPYAVIGGNAVAAWVAEVDESAVRNTRDVDLLVRRSDMDALRSALEGAGFRYRRVSILGGKSHIDMFLDGPGAKAREGVHLIFADEKVGEDDPVPAPGVEESTRFEKWTVARLEALVRMKLVAFRRKDQMHLIDMLDTGLIDDTWPARYPPELAARLQELIDNPE